MVDQICMHGVNHRKIRTILKCSRPVYEGYSKLKHHVESTLVLTFHRDLRIFQCDNNRRAVRISDLK